MTDDASASAVAADEDGTSLRDTSRAHHARIVPHVDALLGLAERVGTVDCLALHAAFAAEHGFVTGQLVPHMDTVEATLYGPLEALMGPRHTMAPMREEHELVRTLVAGLEPFVVHREDCAWREMGGLALRRSLYRLHALLKMHLAEEEQYLAVLDRSLTGQDKAALAARLEHGRVAEA